MFERLEKSEIRFVPVFHLVLVTERRKESFKGSVVGFGDFKCSQYPAEIRAVVAIVEKTDVPSAAESIQKLKQRSRAFRKLKPAYALALDRLRASTHHVTDVEFRHFAVGQIGGFVTLGIEFGLDFVRIFAALYRHSNENLRSGPLAQSVVEFRDYAFPKRIAEL